MRLAAVAGVVLMALLVAACGSSGKSAPAAVPTVAPTSAPAATSAPEATATPEPTPTPEFIPGPREVEFADGQFKVNFLYRSEPDIAAAIDVVDVESIIRPVLERIGPLLGGQKSTINFKGPILAGLNSTDRAQLESQGFVAVPDVLTGRIEIRINPNGSIGVEDLWREIIPLELANWGYISIRALEAAGQYTDSLLDWLIAFGLGMAFQEEVFPEIKEQLGAHRPEFAQVIFDLTPEGERELWRAASPDLDVYSKVVISRFIDFLFGGTGEFPTGAGTALGFRIVKAYQQNNPGATASSLVRVPTDEIFEGSNYNP